MGGHWGGHGGNGTVTIVAKRVLGNVCNDAMTLPEPSAVDQSQQVDRSERAVQHRMARRRAAFLGGIAHQHEPCADPGQLLAKRGGAHRFGGHEDKGDERAAMPGKKSQRIFVTAGIFDPRRRMGFE